jgi:hypothetical protein
MKSRSAASGINALCDFRRPSIPAARDRATMAAGLGKERNVDGAEREDRLLRQVAALLATLASFAEAADGRCFPIRFLILLVLRRAEIVARTFVIDAAQDCGLWPDILPLLRDEPADAAALAGRLRVLAAIVAALLEPEGRRRCGTSRPRRARPSCRPLLHGLPHPAIAGLDRAPRPPPAPAEGRGHGRRRAGMAVRVMSRRRSSPVRRRRVGQSSSSSTFAGRTAVRPACRLVVERR